MPIGGPVLVSGGEGDAGGRASLLARVGPGRSGVREQAERERGGERATRLGRASGGKSRLGR